MKYKRAVQVICMAMVAFVGINFFLWKSITEELLTGKNYAGGDLARMGYLNSLKQPRINYFDLPVIHMEMEEYRGQKVDVITIGDSFSNGGGGGKNSYYQDYLASLNGFTVLNIRPFKDRDSITTAAVLCNDGTLDRMKPRFLLIESSQKFCIEDFARQIDFNLNVILERHDLYKNPSQGKRQPAIEGNRQPVFVFINNGNLKFLLYNLLYRFSDHAFFSKTCVLEMTKSLFSVKNGHKLLFLRDDVKRIPSADTKSIAFLNSNLNALARKLDAKGIKLYFMPCVDKYTLYSDYIRKNPYPRSAFFEELRKLPKGYTLIDTKAILTVELKKGEKDLYYADDTHWSWKAAKKIFETVRLQ